MSPLRPLLALAVAALALISAGSVSAQSDRGLETVKYATSFGNFGRDAFVYVAIDKGYFRDVGLNVDVVPGQGTDNARLLASGTIDYMANDISGQTYQKATAGFPIRVVAVTSQAWQSAIAVLADSSIVQPKDLEGKTYADSPASIGWILFPFYAKRAGLDASKVTFVPTTPQTGPALLASGKVDSLGQFTVGLPLLQKATGKKIRMLKGSRYLPGLLGNGLWTTEQTIASKPGQVRRFTRALLKGLNWAMDNPRAAGNIMQKYVPLADPVVAGQELRILKQYVKTKCTHRYGVGYIDIGKMKSTASLIRNAFHTDKVQYNEIYSPQFVRTATCKLK